jgi:hypothetical protein
MRMPSPRAGLAGLALVIAAVFVSSGPATAQDAQSSSTQYGPIASTALKYLGTHGGQCWTFARQVIYEATGRTLGFDYHLGYLEAGGIQVSAAEAREGDIIQIADPSNTSATASYDGLHTAIILENLGGGLFNVIDSNQNWDEWVRLRPNYNPEAAAARYPNLVVRYYRIPQDGNPIAAPDALAPGDSARVNTPGDVLNLRSAPGLGAPVLARLPHGTNVSVVGGPENASGLRWLRVSTPYGTGWVADLYLARATAAATTPAYRMVVPAITSNADFGP